MKQTDFFIDDSQEELFDEANYAPPVYRPDPERVRVRLYNILAEARAASALPWDTRRVSLYRTTFPQMTLSLPEEEAAQLRFEFEEELVRLKAAWPRRDRIVKRDGVAIDPPEPHIIGREAFAKISEVEGIRLSDEARAMFAEFDRLKLTPEERRRAIVERFKRKG
jgi:hypothetical protein